MAVTRPPKVFYGWWIVLLAVFLNIYQGGILFYGFTLLITPMREEMNWSYTAIASVYLFMGAIHMIVAPALGYFFDKIGPKPLMAGGVFLMGLGLLLLGFAETLWGFYFTFIVANLGASGMWNATGAAVPNWFIKKRGRALGTQSLGYALAGIMTIPFLFLIDSYGWRTAVSVAGIITWFLIIPATAIVRKRPEDYGLWPDGIEPSSISEDPNDPPEINIGVRNAVQTQAFWFLALGFSMGFLAISAIQVYETPFMQSVGYSRRAAALLLTVIPLSTIVGRLGFGYIADYWDKRKAAAIALFLQSIAVIILAFFDSSRVWLIPLFLIFWGLGFGGTVVLRPALQGDLFGRKSFGTIQGVLSTTGEIGFMFAPVVAGITFDLLGSFRPVFIAFAILTLIAAPIILTIRTPRPKPLES